MIVDYHMHLRAPDEQIEHTFEAVEPYVETAADRNVDEIGFTEHVYYFEQTRHLWSMPYHLERCVYDIESYVDAVVDAKRRGYPVTAPHAHKPGPPDFYLSAAFRSMRAGSTPLLPLSRLTS